MEITTGQDLFQILILAFLAITTVILLGVVVNVYMTVKAILYQKAGIEYKPTSINGIWNKLAGVKPMEAEESIMLDHDYDGIKELDNHLPPWWVGLFYACIAFAVIYLLNYHVWHWSPNTAEEYEIAMNDAAEAKEALLALNPMEQIDENSVQLLTGESDLATGKLIYDGNCALCHGPNLEGGIGPNLVDEYWLHGGSLGDVYKTVANGVPEKGMLAWEGTLKPADIEQTVSYIKSLEGTTPANAKDPQGEVYVEEAAEEGVVVEAEEVTEEG